LTGLGFLAGRVVEVGLHGGRGAAEASGDLGDRELLRVAVVKGERRGALRFADAVGPAGCTGHTATSVVAVECTRPAELTRVTRGSRLRRSAAVPSSDAATALMTCRSRVT
jgi:hypothetical protein